MCVWAVSLIVGIVAAIVQQPVPAILIMMILFVVIGQRMGIKYVWLLIYTFSLAGAFIYTKDYISAGNLPAELGISSSYYLKGEITGKIDKIQQYDTYQKIYIKNPIVKIEDEKYTVHGIVVMSDLSVKAKRGETITAEGTIKEFDTARNEGQFDSKNYYKSIGMDYKLGDTSVVQNKAPADMVLWLTELKNKLSHSYTQIDSDLYSGIYKAMVIGDKEELSLEIKDLYQAAGISHILAISGLHIAIIGMGLYKILRRWGVSFVGAGVFSGILIYAYAFITGNGVSTIRATVMFAVFLVAQILGRTYDMLTGAALSAIIILYDNPLMITNSGFLLSFGAILGITLVFPVLKKLVDKKYAEGLLMSLSINLVTMPVITYNYFEIPTYSIVLNVVVVPLMSLVMTGAVLGGMLGVFWIPLGRFFIGVSHYILEFYNWLCELFERIPYNTILLGKPDISIVIIYYVFLLIMLVAVSNIKNIPKLSIVPMVLSLVILLGYKNNDKTFVTMLDVSQGDCIYINFDKDTNALIDCGSSDISDISKYRVIPYLKSGKIKKISYLFLSHMDADHINGVVALLESEDITVENMVVSYVLKDDDKLKELSVFVKQNNCRVLFMMPGDCVTIGENTITCLFPDETFSKDDSNARSMVLDVRLAECKLLFTGDIDTDSEKAMLKKYDLQEYDVLKVAHHGSKYSSDIDFLKEISQDIALISCGEGNSYGHPHKETIGRLNAIGSRVYVTAKCGQITLGIKDDKLAVQVFLD